MAYMKATTDTVPAIYKPGERFCQLVIVPVPDYTITEVEDLTETERDGGFGSTGTTNEDIKTVSAATGAEDQTSEQPQSVPEPAAADETAEASEEQA